MADKYANIDQLIAQGSRLAAITASDSADIPYDTPKAIIPLAAGNIVITPVGGNLDGAGNPLSQTLGNANTIPVLAGVPFDAVRIKRLWATGSVACVAVLGPAVSP